MSTVTTEQGTAHDPLTLVAGDDWQFNISLLDANGSAFDLTGATLLWALMDHRYMRALTTTDVVITIVSPPTLGQCLVKVPASKTTTLAPSYYTDVLRIETVGLVTQTMLWGTVNVMGDPFGAAATPTTTPVTMETKWGDPARINKKRPAPA